MTLLHKRSSLDSEEQLASHECSLSIFLAKYAVCIFLVPLILMTSDNHWNTLVLLFVSVVSTAPLITSWEVVLYIFSSMKRCSACTAWPSNAIPGGNIFATANADADKETADPVLGANGSKRIGMADGMTWRVRYVTTTLSHRTCRLNICVEVASWLLLSRMHCPIACWQCLSLWKLFSIDHM